MGSDSDSPTSPVTQRRVLAGFILFICLAITIPGILATRANESAREIGECKQLYYWNVTFLVSVWLGSLATIMAIFTTYATSAPNLENPHPNVDAYELPPALKTDRTFLSFLCVSGVVLPTLFIWGCVLLARSTCSGHHDLELYFKFVFWLFIVILPPCAICGGIGNYFLPTQESSMTGDSLGDDFVAIQRSDAGPTLSRQPLASNISVPSDSSLPSLQPSPMSQSPEHIEMHTVLKPMTPIPPTNVV